jgi:D-3-phosphoglycerate dehydrogenase
MLKKVVITTTSFGEYDSGAMNLLKENGFDITKNNLGRTLVKREILDLCKGAVGIVAGVETYDLETLNELKGLLAISRVGVGIDTIDIRTADSLGIKVANTPLGPVKAVAELTICLMLDLLRKVSFMDRGVRTGKWNKKMGNLLCGKKVGILGFGRIGRKVAEYLTVFGCDIAYHDSAVKDANEKYRPMRLEELLSWADIITIHVSGKSEIIGEKELRHIRQGSWLINISRGGAVNENALHGLLKNGHISGAAFDVFAKEPYEGALRELDNVILTPHIGSYAIESRMEMEMDAAKNLIKILSEVEKWPKR